ncbi:hypothetical protein Bhyg_17169 [Pseudolycoriella hygida]|uniref:Uncharacterized protein n=1 Tax=Pseudolycoriella hygida TaxID=35572 RepID=A0A9Q0MJ48_9DIPT|nr:hypothetical protein Bhyg_17169 [Pseudolycoriella hygida]
MASVTKRITRVNSRNLNVISKNNIDKPSTVNQNSKVSNLTNRLSTSSISSPSPVLTQTLSPEQNISDLVSRMNLLEQSLNQLKAENADLRDTVLELRSELVEAREQITSIKSTENLAVLSEVSPEQAQVNANIIIRGVDVNEDSSESELRSLLDGLHKMPTMPTNLERFTKPKALISKPKEPIKEVRKGLWTEKFLTHLYTSLKFIQQKNLHQRTAKCLRNIREEVMSYVSTARPSIESDENGSEYQHAVFLQKIIKGRAVQSLLHDGKDANQELIDQMKETFKLESVWKAECCDDWNESSLMDFLGSYLEQEFARYAQQKSLSYKQKLSEQQENIERKEVVRTKEENIASDCLDDVFTDMFQNISESGKFEQIEDGSSNDETSENVIKVPDETKGQQNDQKMVSGKEQIINEIIEHVLQKVIPQTAEGMTNDIINDIIMKTMEMVASVPELDSCGMDKEIGSMLDDLCNQILNSMDMTDSDECSESQIDSLDE